ncbi:MAG TPA: FAD-dependent monooxygenase [Pseudonocardia sp.]|nr:FAD-dependent monooxygenase [Pseudonocardia sp.]
MIGPVVVAGGGIGGLALGIALRRHGVEVTVVERATEFGEVGSGVVLAPNAMSALTALGGEVATRVRAEGSALGTWGATGHCSPFVTAAGRQLAGVSFDRTEERWGVPVVSMLRARLQRVLLDEARACGVGLRTGTAVTGYTDHGAHVELLLAEGEPVTGDLLVGADGLRSAVRRQLLADGEPSYRGYSAVRGTGPAPDAYPDGFIAYGRGLILFASPIGGGELYWAASIASPAGVWPAKDRQTAHHDLLELLAGWDTELASVVGKADPAAYVLTDIADRDPVPSWHRGRVVLLGDAAHPMVYTMGQGAGTTLEDAVVLAHHLVTADGLDAALGRYEAERTVRTARIQKQSRMLGRIGHVKGRPAVWLRDRMMALMDRVGGDPEKQDAEVFGWRPPR